jgi:hypothetical protein
MQMTGHFDSPLRLFKIDSVWRRPKKNEKLPTMGYSGRIVDPFFSKIFAVTDHPLRFHKEYDTSSIPF